MAREDAHRPHPTAFPSPDDTPTQPRDGTAPAAASLPPLHDGAHAAASTAGGGIVDLYTGPAVFLPVTWSRSSTLGGDGDALRLPSGEPVVATVVSASALVFTAGAPVATASAPSSYGNSYLVAADGAARRPAAALPAPRPTYLHLFYGDAAADGTISTIPFDATFTLAVSPDSAVDGSPAGQWAGSAAMILLALADHVMQATVNSRLPHPGVPMDLPVQHDAEVHDEGVADICHICAQRDSSWFAPCCMTLLCSHCSLQSPLQCTCSLGVRHVPIPPLFTTASGEPVPRTFVELLRPRWQIYRYIPGPSFVVISYYDVASAYHRPDLGVRFQTHIYRREGEHGWAWRIEFLVEIPPVDPLHIFWRVVVAPHHHVA